VRRGTMTPVSCEDDVPVELWSSADPVADSRRCRSAHACLLIGPQPVQSQALWWKSKLEVRRSNPGDLVEIPTRELSYHAFGDSGVCLAAKSVDRHGNDRHETFSPLSTASCAYPMSQPCILDLLGWSRTSDLPTLYADAGSCRRD
jgi:hypothetical protein